jgi:hypothetical protein
MRLRKEVSAKNGAEIVAYEKDEDDLLVSVSRLLEVHHLDAIRRLQTRIQSPINSAVRIGNQWWRRRRWICRQDSVGEVRTSAGKITVQKRIETWG